MSISPTFVATFEDGETTRMTVHQSRTELDLDRGVRLARYAYCSRKKTDTPPPIKRARYKHNGKVIKTYGAKEVLAAEAAAREVES